MSFKVSLFVGGVQKSGTRSVSNYFRQHENVAVHSKKEGHFFDQDENFDDNTAKSHLINEYINSFDISSKTKVFCDITPDYIFRKNSIERIYKYNRDARWVILLRNPIHRAFSAWNMEINRKAESMSFEEALVSELSGNSKSRRHDRFQYIGRSRYSSQLEKLWRYFPQPNCYIYCAEMIWQDPLPFLNSILKSLNLPENQAYQFEHIHKGNYTSKLSIKARNILMEELKTELTQLPKNLGWKNNPWIMK